MQAFRPAVSGRPKGLHYIRADFFSGSEAGHDVPDDPVRDDIVVIGADTAVVVDGEIFGKPRDAADAERMLRRLSGRRHEVLTGVSVRRASVERGGVDTTVVECLALTDADVSWYVASGEGRDKAAAAAK